MITASMMYDIWSDTLSDEEKAEESYKCICGYALREDSNYINNIGQRVTIMVCDSCGHTEPWIDESDSDALTEKLN